MSKTGKTYLVIGLMAIMLMLVFEYNRPKNINWFPSYVATHKIPYGTAALHSLLPNHFESIQNVYRSPYEFLSKNTSTKGTYLFINNRLEFGATDLKKLLAWVEEGNHAYFAAEYYGSAILDTLHLEIASLYDDGDIEPTFLHDLRNPKANIKRVEFSKDYAVPFFKKIDTLNSEVLASVAIKDQSDRSEVTAIQMAYGQGMITISTFPKAFTNYFILKNRNHKYTGGLLGHIDIGSTLLIDHHHKSGKTFHTSPMYLFLNTKSFKWAYYLVLIGALFYVVFEGKRKQRAIPVIEPLKNQTLAFTRTIANMYFENGKQLEIARHKVNYFLDFIRQRFQLSTDRLDEVFYRDLALRSNQSEAALKKLFEVLIGIKQAKNMTNEELKDLEKRIQEFKASTNGT